MVFRPSIALCLIVGLGLAGRGTALAADATPTRSVGTVDAAACPIVESAARAAHIPVELLTRLVWTESRFRASVTSPKGAQGIAQFMPDTAAERGLLDPFDPEQAIPKAARLLADLAKRFGNLGLAAAAYNAGPARVTEWLGGSASLPAETRNYVLAITGRSAEDWAGNRQPSTNPSAGEPSCTRVTAEMRAGEAAELSPLAPWGVQLSGNFSKPAALVAFERARQRYRGVIGDLRPMVIGTVLRSRGTRPFYRVLVPASSRAQADRLCSVILADGGACVTVRS